jgi:hypothetical protein
MEQTCALFVNHLDVHVSITINDSHTFQFVYTLSMMNPLKFGLGNSCLTIVLFNFVHMICYILMSLDCMLQITMVMTL